MANLHADARIQYLDDASKHLLKSSPAISAHLQTVRQSIVGEDNGSSQRNEERICAACGSTLIPGWSCESIKETSTKRTRKDRLAKNENGMSLKLRCHRCNAITTIQIVKPKARLRETKYSQNPTRNATIASATTQETSPDRTSTVPEVANKASRKRQRSKRATLQSMLTKQKAVEAKTPNGFGLDLMDLMKP